jgi:hypothetical protein
VEEEVWGGQGPNWAVEPYDDDRGITHTKWVSVAHGDPKWGMEYAVFFNILALMARREILFTKELCYYEEDRHEERGGGIC